VESATAILRALLANGLIDLSDSEFPVPLITPLGWKVMRGVTNPQTGDVIYTHILNPVVPNADYNITSIIYEVVTDPTEQKQIYDWYAGAVSQNLGANVGRIVSDFSN